MKIFFDLDGTLIDAKPRLYHLFTSLVPESQLSFDDYWNLKRDKINHKSILENHFNYSETMINSFMGRWMEEIESETWLEYDLPFIGTKGLLEELSNNGYIVYLVTARQSEEKAINQLRKLDISSFFNDILVTGQKKEKYDLIRENIDTETSDWLVGDTGKDIQTGQKLGIKTAAVLTGFLSEKHLLNYKPNIIVNSVLDINFPKN